MSEDVALNLHRGVHWNALQLVTVTTRFRKPSSYINYILYIYKYFLFDINEWNQLQYGIEIMFNFPCLSVILMYVFVYSAEL